MKKHFTTLLLLSTGIALTGCDTFRNTFGLDHYQADELNIAENPPLSMPPSYSLTPPTNSSSSDKNEQKKADDENTTTKAKEALLGRSEKAKDTTTNNAKVVVTKAAEVQKADPEIRKTVTEEEKILSSDSDSIPDKLSKMGQKIVENAKNTSNEPANINTAE
ncbi:MAG: DUF3035 domain-containing protein [Pseudomonadota bacterium]